MFYLVTGLSGTGKTAVGEKLRGMGYRVIEGDAELVRNGLKPWDGKPWEWDRARVRKHLGVKTHVPVFVVGGAENQSEFLHYFKKVYELIVPAAVTIRRLKERKVTGKLRTAEHSVPGAQRIDSSRCVNAVMFDILRGIGRR